MNVALFLDTSLLGFSFALKSLDNSSQILCQVSDPSLSASSMRLSTLVNEQLEALGLKQESIKIVVVSRGPGSFTGIRIGLSWAHGFCLSQEGRHLLGVSSLALIPQYLAKKHDLSEASVLLANTKTTGFMASKPQDMETQLRFVGETANLLSEKPSDLFVDSSYDKSRVPEAAHSLERGELAQLALEAMLEGVDLLDQKFYNKRDYPGTPLYLRKSSVEERLADLKGKDPQ